MIRFAFLLLLLALPALAQPISPPAPVGPAARTVANFPVTVSTGDAVYGVARNTQYFPANVGIQSGQATLALDAGYVFSAGVSFVVTSGNATAAITVPSGTFDLSVLGKSTYSITEFIGGQSSGHGFNNSVVTSNGITKNSATSFSLTANNTSASSETMTSFCLYNSSVNANGSYCSYNATPQQALINAHHRYLLVSGATMAAGAKSITGLPTNTFQSVSDVTQYGPNFQHVTRVRINDLTTGCTIGGGKAWAYIVTNTSTSATLDIASPCAIAAGDNIEIWWGRGLFDETMVGATVHVPQVGAASGISGAPAATLKTTIASYQDPFHVTLAATAGVTPTPVNGRMVSVGTDDEAAMQALVQTAAQSNISEIDFTGRGLGLANGITGRTLRTTPNLQYDGAVRRCRDNSAGGGQVFPDDSQFLSLVADCRAAKPPLPYPFGLRASDLKVISAVSGVATVDIVGDSEATFSSSGQSQGYVGAGIAESLAYWLPIINKNITGVVINNRAVGGATLAALDPYGPSFGNGSGIPSSANISTTKWYTNSGNQWVSYVAADCPHLVVAMFQNDAFSTNWTSFYNVGAWVTSQTGAGTIYATCGSTRYADLLWVTGYGSNENPSTCNVSNVCDQGGFFMQGMIRSLLLAGGAAVPTPATSGGTIGFVDVYHEITKRMTGFDPDSTKQTIARQLMGTGTSTSAEGLNLPITHPNYVYGIGYNGNFISVSGQSTAAGLWASATGIGTLQIKLSEGELGTPYNITGSSVGLAVGYPGNQLNLSAGATYFQYYATLFDTTQTCTVSSGGGVGTSTVTFAAACGGRQYGNGYAVHDIDISGCGITGTFTTTATWSLDGKTATTAATFPQSASGSCTVRLYKNTIGTPASPIVTTVPITQGFSGNGVFLDIAVRQMWVDVWADPGQAQMVINRAVPKFGGLWVPSLTKTGSGTVQNRWGRNGNGFPTASELNMQLYGASNPLFISWELFGSPTQDLSNGYVFPYLGGFGPHPGSLIGEVVKDVFGAAFKAFH